VKGITVAFISAVRNRWRAVCIERCTYGSEGGILQQGSLPYNLACKGNRFTRVLCEEGSIFGVEMKFFDTIRTGKGEGNLLCKN